MFLNVWMYLSYDTAETSYADAGNVTGDTVRQQEEFTYDQASNFIQRTRRVRFHDATGTGELTTLGGAQPKARPILGSPNIGVVPTHYLFVAWPV